MKNVNKDQSSNYLINLEVHAISNIILQYNVNINDNEIIFVEPFKCLNRH